MGTQQLQPSERSKAIKERKLWFASIDQSIADIKGVIKDTDRTELGELKELRSIAAALRRVKQKAARDGIDALQEQTKVILGRINAVIDGKFSLISLACASVQAALAEPESLGSEPAP